MAQVKEKKEKKALKALHVSRSLPEASIKISPALSWVFPYLKKVRLKMPNLVLPKSVRSYKPSINRIMRVLGNAYYETGKIVLATHTQVLDLDKSGKLRVKKVVRLSRMKILETLAHELGHLKYHEHGYEHEHYSRMIFNTFGLREKCSHCKGSGKVSIEMKP